MKTWNIDDRIEPTPAGQDYAASLELEPESARNHSLSYFCPTLCPICKIGSILGQPTCLEAECPGRTEENAPGEGASGANSCREREISS